MTLKYQTLPEMLDHRARGDGAIVYLEGEGAEKRLTLANLRRRALGILHHLQGIGAKPGATELAIPALAKFDARALDPLPYLPRITNRVDLVHGMDDDVIPYEQSHVLATKLTNADVHVHITGLYGHTGAQRPPLSALGKELITMVRVLRVLSA